MSYIDFKNAYLFELTLPNGLNSIQKTLFQIQKKFDDCSMEFILDKNYTSALYFYDLLSKFKKLIENDNLEVSNLLYQAMLVYKDLLIHHTLLKNQKNTKVRNIISKNDFLSHTA